MEVGILSSCSDVCQSVSTHAQKFGAAGFVVATSLVVQPLVIITGHTALEATRRGFGYEPVNPFFEGDCALPQFSHPRGNCQEITLSVCRKYAALFVVGVTVTAALAGVVYGVAAAVLKTKK